MTQSSEMARDFVYHELNPWTGVNLGLRQFINLRIIESAPCLLIAVILISCLPNSEGVLPQIVPDFSSKKRHVGKFSTINEIGRSPVVEI